MIPRVVNWASTWENHRAGSFDQYGGSLMLTVKVIGGGVACATELELVVDDVSSVAIVAVR